MLKTICLLGFLLVFNSLYSQRLSGDTETRKDPLQLSEAEIIVRFQKFIANDQQRLIRMKSRSAQLAREIDELTRQFEGLDSQLDAVPEVADNSRDKVLEEVISSLDLHLRSRQVILQQITLVESKIKKQKELVNYITIGQIPVGEEDSSNLIASDTIAKFGINSETQNRKELAALEDLRILEAELVHVRQNLLIVDQLVRMNNDDIELTKVLTDASAELKLLLKEQPQDPTVVKHLREVSRRFSQDTLLISTLNDRIDNLITFRIPMVEVVSEAEEEVQNAMAHLEFLQSSMAPHRVLYWLKSNLPKIAVILFAFFVIWIGGRWVVRLILNRMIRSRKDAESADRLETLKLASGSIITIFVVFGSLMVLLSEIGVDLAVVVGGAAVLSLVIAFGAQSLVKDYLSGFMILLENQYRVGNVVKINETTGIVENMSLRLTVLRDLEGISHFIPHGQILDISNLTHIWSQVLFDIGISYNEQVDKVMEVLKELGAEMNKDPAYSELIIGDLEMLGVDKFNESAIVIRFLVKTRPLKQWIVKRELLRRIKNRFDELGIEIPYPHLTVYHRGSNKGINNNSYSHGEVQL
ncbi:MAG: mechanosensitive ion channel family protein [Candidatus Cyclobacteriaceae bacterium M2_1C_046]